MSYDHWKSTDPADEYLGPDPDGETGEEPEIQVLVDHFVHSLLIDAEELFRMSLDPATDALLEAEEAKIILAQTLIDDLARKYRERRNGRQS